MEISAQPLQFLLGSHGGSGHRAASLLDCVHEICTVGRQVLGPCGKGTILGGSADSGFPFSSLSPLASGSPASGLQLFPLTFPPSFPSYLPSYLTSYLPFDRPFSPDLLIIPSYFTFPPYLLTLPPHGTFDPCGLTVSPYLPILPSHLTFSPYLLILHFILASHITFSPYLLKPQLVTKNNQSKLLLYELGHSCVLLLLLLLFLVLSIISISAAYMRGMSSSGAAAASCNMNDSGV